MKELYNSLEKVLDNLKNWNEFQFCFERKAEDIVEAIKIAKAEINGSLNISEKNKKSGIYQIINNENKTLYIGKGVNIADRILSHYKSYLKIGRLDKGKDWIEFFSKINDNVIIKWIEIDDDNKYRGETLRIIFERLLTDKIMSETNNEQPLFEVNHRSIK